MELPHIDHGRPFDWGRASADYARWRDIYPPEFFRPLTERGLCGPGRKVLDLGTGTGVLPRALYRQGARFTGVDPAPEQIRQARALANRDGMEIDFRCSAAEDCGFPDGSFDTATACQCFTYFNHARLAPRLHRMLKPGGIFAVLYMAWLPGEDPVAGQSEALILRHNPAWTGCGETGAPSPSRRITGPGLPWRPRRCLISGCPSPGRAGTAASGPAEAWARPCRRRRWSTSTGNTGPCWRPLRRRNFPCSTTPPSPCSGGGTGRRAEKHTRGARFL